MTTAEQLKKEIETLSKVKYPGYVSRDFVEAQKLLREKKKQLAELK